MRNSFFYLASSLTLLSVSCKKESTDNNNNNNNGNTPCVRTVVEINTDITTPTTWEDCHTYIISVNQISVTSNLTIQPGAIIKFKDVVSDNAIIVTNSGTINAIGTKLKPIVFTSFRDDANGGDNNGDGTNSFPARFDWGGIIINSNNCVFKNCSFLYGGKGPGGGAGQPTLEFSYYYGIIDSCLFAHCGGETTYSGYGVVDAVSCHDPRFSITNSTFYGCVKPLFINPFISIDNSNTFHNPANPSEKNELNGIFITSESNEATSNVSWLETEVPFVLTGSLYVGDGHSLVLAPNVIIKVATLPSPGYNKISIREGSSFIEGHDQGGVFFTSYLDDSKGGDTNGDGTASAPSQGDWYGIQDISATITTNNSCYAWSNILYAKYP